MMGRIGVVRGVLGCWVLACAASAWGQSINSLSVGQITWQDTAGVPYAVYSEWGDLTVNLTPDGFSTYYLNMGAKAAGSGSPYSWMVQNLPVFPSSVIGDVNQTVYLDLEDLPGFVAGSFVGNLDLALSLDPTPQAGLIGSIFVNNVTPLSLVRQAQEGKLGVLPGYVGKPQGHKAPGAAAVATDVIQHQNVPGVQEGNNQCLAGSFARSLKWLDNRYDLPGLPNATTAQQVFATITGPTYKVSDPNTTYEQDVASKQTYFQTLQAGGVTKILDLANAIGPVTGVTETTGVDLVTWLYQELPTEDVELHYDTHIVTVTGIYKQGGKVFVKYRDDEVQGDNTKGDASEKDAELVKIGGNYFFNRRDGLANGQVKVAISESIPEPGTMGLLSLGMLAAMRRTRG